MSMAAAAAMETSVSLLSTAEAATTTAMVTSMEMHDMDMSSSQNMPSMTMTFFESLTTPLLWSSWRPSTPLTYSATCLTLIALSALGRVLIAFKPLFEETSWRRRKPTHHDDLEADLAAHDQAHGDTGSSGGCREAEKDDYGYEYLPLNIQPMVMVAKSKAKGTTMLSRTVRATYEMVTVGVGYLL